MTENEQNLDLEIQKSLYFSIVFPPDACPSSGALRAPELEGLPGTAVGRLMIVVGLENEIIPSNNLDQRTEAPLISERKAV